jgi:hypothetical protein
MLKVTYEVVKDFVLIVITATWPCSKEFTLICLFKIAIVGPITIVERKFLYFSGCLNELYFSSSSLTGFLIDVKDLPSISMIEVAFYKFSLSLKGRTRTATLTLDIIKF